MTTMLADVVRWLFNILYGMLIIRIILSWLPMFRGGRLVEFIFAFTEPILSPIRNIIERSPLGGPGMMFDFSPFLAIIMFNFISSFLLSMINMMG